MTPTTSTKFIERVRFFDNERLIASDLQAIDDFARQMRWLHNRSLHQPGVASGYAVAGEKGDRQVTIQPGYALDVLGREIVLTQAWTQPVPPESGDGQGGPATFDLTVSYPAVLPESESRTADCASAVPGSVRLQESPVFCWVAAFKKDPLRDEIESGKRIVLARVEVLNCQLNHKISLAQRRDARPGVHPFVYAAIAGPDWVVTDRALGIEIAPPAVVPPVAGAIRTIPIDTSAAGFRTTPCYFANLADDPTIELNGRTVRLDVFVSIAYPTTTGFEVSLLIPTLLLFAAGLPLDAVRAALATPAWKLEWMGVEA
jgi:hypothetical protein